MRLSKSPDLLRLSGEKWRVKLNLILNQVAILISDIVAVANSNTEESVTYFQEDRIR